MSNDTIAPSKQETHEQSAVAVRSGGGANHNTPRNIGLIIKREYKNRVTQRSYIITSIILMVLLAIAACVPTIIQYFTATSNSQTKLAIINNASPIAGMSGDTLTQYIDTNLNGTANSQTTSAASQTSSQKPPFAITTATADNTASLQQKVKNGSLDILLILDRSANQDLHFSYYTNSGNFTDTTATQIQTVAGQLNFLDKSSRLGLTPAQTSSLFTQPDFTVIHTQQDQDKRSVAERLAGFFLGYAGVLLIFMSVFLYGIGVAQGVAEEKGNRIMEILVNAATPFQLMVGKIVGIGAAGVTQMLGLVIVGISALLLQAPLKTALLGSNAGGFSLDITATSIMMILMVLLYFVLGFLLYSTLFAAVGALVSRQDEVQTAATPITWLFMIGYIVSFAIAGASDATWLKVMSFIPFWTPTIMLMRIGTSTLAWWEIPLSVVLMIIAIFICALLSARIYRFGILMYGQKPKFSQLVKLARMK